MLDEDKEAMNKYFTSYRQTPPVTPVEEYLFDDVKKLARFLQTWFNFQLPDEFPNMTTTSASLCEFIEVACMKISRNYTRELCELDNQLLLAISKKFMNSSIKDNRELRLNEYCFPQEDLESNPYYIIYEFLYAPIVPHPETFYIEFYSNVCDFCKGDYRMIASGGNILMLVMYKNYIDLGEQANLKNITTEVYQVIKQYEPLIFHSWLVSFLRICGTLPSLKLSEKLSTILLKYCFEIKHFRGAQEAVLLWLPHWGKTMLPGQFMDNLPKTLEVTDPDKARIFEAIFRALNKYITESMFFKFATPEGVTRDDYVMAFLLSGLRMLPFHIGHLKQLKIDYPKKMITEFRGDYSIANYLLLLADQLSGSCTRGELFLSAYSIYPIPENFLLIEELISIGHGYYGEEIVHDVENWTYVPPKQLVLEHPEWPKEIYDEFVDVLGMSRILLFDWRLPPRDLHYLCSQHLNHGSIVGRVAPENYSAPGFVDPTRTGNEEPRGPAPMVLYAPPLHTFTGPAPDNEVLCNPHDASVNAIASDGSTVLTDETSYDSEESETSSSTTTSLDTSLSSREDSSSNDESQ